MKCLSIFRFLAGALAFVAVGHAKADSTGKWHNSQEVYDKVCGYCHEVNVGPVIKGRNLAPELITAMVRFGNRGMPSFRHTEIDDAMLAGVVKMVSTSPPPVKK